jgi:hypothetical protein
MNHARSARLRVQLLAEYDAAIGKTGKTYIEGKHAGMINYGLADDDDMVDRRGARCVRAAAPCC